MIELPQKQCLIYTQQYDTIKSKKYDELVSADPNFARWCDEYKRRLVIM